MFCLFKFYNLSSHFHHNNSGGLSVNDGMGNQGTEWGEWWECGESGWEWEKSAWESSYKSGIDEL